MYYNSFAIQTFYISTAKQAPYAIYLSTNSSHAWDSILAYYESYALAEQAFNQLYAAFADHAPVFSFQDTPYITPDVLKVSPKKEKQKKPTTT